MVFGVWYLFFCLCVGYFFGRSMVIFKLYMYKDVVVYCLFDWIGVYLFVFCVVFEYVVIVMDGNGCWVNC